MTTIKIIDAVKDETYKDQRGKTVIYRGAGSSSGYHVLENPHGVHYEVPANYQLTRIDTVDPRLADLLTLSAEGLADVLPSLDTDLVEALEDATEDIGVMKAIRVHLHPPEPGEVPATLVPETETEADEPTTVLVGPGDDDTDEGAEAEQGQADDDLIDKARENPTQDNLWALIDRAVRVDKLHESVRSSRESLKLETQVDVLNEAVAAEFAGNARDTIMKQLRARVVKLGGSPWKPEPGAAGFLAAKQSGDTTTPDEVIKRHELKTTDADNEALGRPGEIDGTRPGTQPNTDGDGLNDDPEIVNSHGDDDTKAEAAGDAIALGNAAIAALKAKAEDAGVVVGEAVKCPRCEGVAVAGGDCSACGGTGLLPPDGVGMYLKVECASCNKMIRVERQPPTDGQTAVWVYVDHDYARAPCTGSGLPSAIVEKAWANGDGVTLSHPDATDTDTDTDTDDAAQAAAEALERDGRRGPHTVEEINDCDGTMGCGWCVTAKARGLLGMVPHGSSLTGKRAVTADGDGAALTLNPHKADTWYEVGDLVRIERHNDGVVEAPWDEAVVIEVEDEGRPVRCQWHEDGKDRSARFSMKTGIKIGDGGAGKGVTYRLAGYWQDANGNTIKADDWTELGAGDDATPAAASSPHYKAGHEDGEGGKDAAAGARLGQAQKQYHDGWLVGRQLYETAEAEAERAREAELKRIYIQGRDHGRDGGGYIEGVGDMVDEDCKTYSEGWERGRHERVQFLEAEAAEAERAWIDEVTLPGSLLSESLEAVATEQDAGKVEALYQHVLAAKTHPNDPLWAVTLGRRQMLAAIADAGDGTLELKPKPEPEAEDTGWSTDSPEEVADVGKMQLALETLAKSLPAFKRQGVTISLTVST